MDTITQPYKNWSNELYRLTYDEWLEKYKPIKNHLNNYDQIAFETFGDEIEYVWGKPNKFVWTEVDGYDGSYIVAGKHYINRIQYYLTENPWTDDMTEVPLSIDNECDCMSEGDAKIDCGECGGVGYMTFYIDTREELEMIYGPQDV